MIKRQFQFWLCLLFVSFFSFFNFSISSHGFHRDTIICCTQNYCKKTIFQMIEQVREKYFHTVASYNARKTRWFHFNKEKWVAKDIKAGGYSRTPVHCKLSFNVPDNSSELFTVVCSPIQKFYRASDNTWVPVYKLHIGDRLLARHDKHIRLAGISVIQEPLDVYTIQVKNTHVFLVTEYGLVAHNFTVPFEFFAGIIISFGAGSIEGATAGSFFGPATCVGGAVVGGLAAVAINACIQDKVAEYSFSCGGSNILPEYELRSCGGMKTLPDYGLPCGGGSIFPEYEQLPCGGANSVFPDYGYSCGAVNRLSDYPLSCGGSSIANLVSKNESAVQWKKFTGKPADKSIEKDINKHRNGIYKGASYHHPNGENGRKSRAPSDGQAALDNSVKIKDTSDSRIGVSNGEIVRLNKTLNDEYHGYVLSWEEASRIKKIKDALIDNGFVNSRGKIK